MTSSAGVAVADDVSVAAVAAVAAVVSMISPPSSAQSVARFGARSVSRE
jgi:hypothetical protein